MEFLVDYASFLAKTVTLVVAIVIVLIALASMRRGRSKQGGGHLEVHKLNEFYKSMRERLEQAVLEKDAFKALRKREAKAAKQNKKPETPARVFVLDFDGDIRASAVDNLRHEITALLTMATPQDEVVLRLESGGGNGARLWPGRVTAGAHPRCRRTADSLCRQGGGERRLHDGVHRQPHSYCAVRDPWVHWCGSPVAERSSAVEEA